MSTRQPQHRPNSLAETVYFSSLLPHFEQNAPSLGFDTPHDEQKMFPPTVGCVAGWAAAGAAGAAGACAAGAAEVAGAAAGAVIVGGAAAAAGAAVTAGATGLAASATGAACAPHFGHTVAVFAIWFLQLVQNLNPG